MTRPALARPAARAADDRPDPTDRAVRTPIAMGAARPRRSPTMRASLSFLTSTTSTGDNHGEAPAATRLEVIGYDPVAHRILGRERTGERVTAAIVIPTRGEHAGAPMALAPDALPRLAGELVALVPVSTSGFELTTRVVQRRGLRLTEELAPIRKFALALGVRRHLGGIAIAAGRQMVVAYLRPRATLRQIWTLPGGAGDLAIVTYCGSPIGLGADRDAAVLVAPAMH